METIIKCLQPLILQMGTLPHPSMLSRQWLQKCTATAMKGDDTEFRACMVLWPMMYRPETKQTVHDIVLRAVLHGIEKLPPQPPILGDYTSHYVILRYIVNDYARTNSNWRFIIDKEIFSLLLAFTMQHDDIQVMKLLCWEPIFDGMFEKYMKQEGFKFLQRKAYHAINVSLHYLKNHIRPTTMPIGGGPHRIIYLLEYAIQYDPILLALLCNPQYDKGYVTPSKWMYSLIDESNREIYQHSTTVQTIVAVTTVATLYVWLEFGGNKHYVQTAIQNMKYHWSRRLHSTTWSPPCQTTVWTILLAAQRFSVELPEEVWCEHVFPCLQQQDFIPLPLVTFL